MPAASRLSPDVSVWLPPGPQAHDDNLAHVLLASVDEEFFALAMPRDDLDRLLPATPGHAHRPQPQAEPRDPQRYAEVVAGLSSCGMLRPDVPFGAVTVCGAGHVAQALIDEASLLQASGALTGLLHRDLWPTTPDDLSDLAAMGPILCVADEPRHDALLALDGEAAALDMPLLAVTGEGPHVVAGPWRRPGGRWRAGYRDLAARRIAATIAPDELQDWWRVAHDAERVLHLPRPDRTTAAAAARLIWRSILSEGDCAVGDAVAPDLRTHQLLVRADLTLSRHPVLPWPQAGDDHAARPAEVAP